MHKGFRKIFDCLCAKNRVTIAEKSYVQISWFSYETICHVVFANVLAIGGMLNNMGLEMLMNMFGGLGAGSMNIPSRSDGYCSLSLSHMCLFTNYSDSQPVFHFVLPVPPEQLYATQLSQLQEMGFFDTQENIRALTATAGNVHAAVERLLGNPGQ